MIAQKKGKLRADGLVGVMLFALIIQGLGCHGLHHDRVQQGHIKNAFKPEVIAQNAAKIARECKAPPAPVALAKAALEAAQLAEDAADTLRHSMSLVDFYYWEKLTATKIRAAQVNMAASLATQADSLKQLAGMALNESETDHNIWFMHFLYLPPRYIDVSCSRRTLINRAVAAAKTAQAKVQAAYDKIGHDRHGTDVDKADISAWLGEAIALSNTLDSLDTAAGKVALGDALDDIAQAAVRAGYKAKEVGYRALALSAETQRRGLGELVQQSTEDEVAATERYNEALAAAEKAENQTAEAAYAAYAAALACGVSTKSVVPRPPQENAAVPSP